MRKKSSSSSTHVDYLSSVADLMAGLFFVLFIAFCFLLIQYNEKDKSLNWFQRYQEENKLRVQLEAQLNKETTRRIEADQKLKSLTDRFNNLEQKEIEQSKRIERYQNYLKNSDLSRETLLRKIRDELKRLGINVEINPENGVLRLPEEVLTFKTGKADLSPTMLTRLEQVRGALSRYLPCFTAQNSNQCSELNPDNHYLDAIFVEGHTDNQPFGSDPTGKLNRRLSTDRANAVYEYLMSPPSTLSTLKNPNDQPLFSLSGYGEERPVKGHEHTTPVDDKVNRRIEIRFVMVAPSSMFFSSGE